MAPVPSQRIRALNDAAIRPDGTFVLYWMVASRRTRFNFGLQRAVELGHELARPLLVLEALRCDYPWASERFHSFILTGMTDNAARFESADVSYHPYVEPRPGAGKRLLAALGKLACAVVTDDFPAFMIPRMLEAASRRVRVRMEAVDSNGVLPLSAADRAFPTAFAFRRFLQRELRGHLGSFPEPDPLARSRLPRPARLPGALGRRWPAVSPADLADPRRLLRRLPLDRSVGAADQPGGEKAGRRRLGRFVRGKLAGYAEGRNHPGEDATSGLSPYLHFGHVSAHQVVRDVLRREGWTFDRLADGASGSRSGWWGVSDPAEAFLDQVVTWRELGYNMARHARDHEHYRSLPPWARKTLEEHAKDRRTRLYALESFESAKTHDELWNAAQRQLVREGRMHNYLRMLWGKKILEWTRNPIEALDIMIELNNKYALDGRDPNSYSGIFWVLGRYDRPWGPERPVFGKVRYMSSENTARKLRLGSYLQRYGADGTGCGG